MEKKDGRTTPVEIPVSAPIGLWVPGNGVMVYKAKLLPRMLKNNKPLCWNTITSTWIRFIGFQAVLTTIALKCDLTWFIFEGSSDYSALWFYIILSNLRSYYAPFKWLMVSSSSDSANVKRSHYFWIRLVGRVTYKRLLRTALGVKGVFTTALVQNRRWRRIKVKVAGLRD